MEKQNPFENIKYNQRLIAQILERCKTATPKVAQRAREFFVPKIEKTPPAMMQYMDYLETDFIYLIRDPKHSRGEGVYDNWTQREIAELYIILFGGEVPEWWMENPKNQK